MKEIKEFYKLRSETNWTKRYQSPYLLRRYFSRTVWRITAEPVKERSIVLDAGCGDGVFSTLLALQRPRLSVIAMDISPEAVKRAKEAAKVYGVADRIDFVVGDLESMPFKDESIPAVVCCHVLEHLPDFDKGLKETKRVLRPDGIQVISIPTCLNLSAMVLLGGDDYWKISKRAIFAIWKGLFMVIRALFQGREGVNEGYAGHLELPHLRYFPWKAIQRIEGNGLKVAYWMADSLLIPYLFPPFIKFQQWIDEKLRAKRFWRNFGLGVVIVVKKSFIT